ncbi:phosphopantetheine-binding protein [Streptomyces sp. WAC 01529]|uniref:phosphopantetheine-binding protein n=1 Tax=Streptomyces sp. WAC 01529 TaxID=2203205 RepID=UPI001F0CDCE5|nr:phosphopantetheine-binding protein [Streptomyces sp. WAC 01529]
MDDTTGVVLRAPRYVLGETAIDHTDIKGFADFIDQRQMMPDADMWGWGAVHTTALDTAALAVRAGRRTLRAAAVEPSEVDALVLCSTTFPAEVEAHGELIASVLGGLELGSVPVTGITLNRCANMLSGLRVAAGMVASGRHRTVLVITADRVAAESERLTDFALFSDGAASCLVSRRVAGAPESYEWVADASAQDPAALGRGNEISADLARAANELIFAEAGIGIEAIDGLLHNNIFLPVVTMKEVQAGFAQSQLDTSNIARVGHCFAADPLINLADQRSAGTLRDGGLYLLASSVSGLRMCVLLRAHIHEGVTEVQKSVEASPATLENLRTTVRKVMQLPESEEVDTRTPRQLGAGSLQTVALQFRILQETSVNVEMSELVGDLSIADIAALIDERRPTTT